MYSTDRQAHDVRVVDGTHPAFLFIPVYLSIGIPKIPESLLKFFFLLPPVATLRPRRGGGGPGDRPTRQQPCRTPDAPHV